VGEGTVIDVGPGHHAGRGHRLVGAAAFHDQWCPLGDLRAVFAVFHAVIAVMGAHGAVALTQEGDVVRAPDETQVRAGVDEGLRIGDGALADQMGPQLARDVELGVHLERLGDVDAAVVPLRGVVQLAIGGMAGAGVVPALGALLGAIVQALEQGHAEGGVQLFEQGAQGGAHDAGADQHDVG